MVKLLAPLCSLAAHGALGNTIIYAQLGMTNYAKAYAAPTNPNTSAQKTIRLGIRYITQSWQALSTDQKETWTNLAQQDQLSLYHAYLKYNAQRWRNFLIPSPVPANDDSLTVSEDLFTYTRNGDEHSFSISNQPETYDCWCCQIAANPVPAFTPERTDIITAGNTWTEETKGTHYTTWTRPYPITYYFKVRIGSTLGGTTPWYNVEQEF